MVGQGEEARKQLYRDLLNDKSLGYADRIKKYSFNSFQDKLLNDDRAQARLTADLIEKGKVKDGTDFYEKYILAEVKPIPAPKAAPVAPVQQVVEPMAMQEEAYIPPPQPVVGSPEYEAQLQKQYGGMAPTLGATFGGAPAAFETKEQKKQEQISPAFKAQQLAFEDVPIASEQRRAQREFTKAAKEQQQAALRGGTGAELKKYRQAESEGPVDRVAANVEALWEGAKNAGVQIFNGLKTVMNAAALNETPMDEDEREYYQQQEFGKMYEASKKAENNFQDELYRLNVSNDVLKAVDEGNYSKLPEATLQTIGNVGISAISSFLTGGGSMYFQTLPEQYRDGVEAIAREKGITPEDVIRSGEDAKMTAQTVGGIVAALERAGAGRLSKSIMNKGGYKAVRDFLIRNGFGKNVGRVGGLGYAGSGEFATEYAQQGAQQLGRIAAASEDASQFFKKLPKEFLSEEAFKERFGAGVGGFVGGAGVVGLGRGLKKAFGGGISLDKFSEEISNNELIQNAAKGYEDNITRAKEQGRKPDSFNQKQLKKIVNDPESWVKDEIKYLKQTIEGNKKANIDSKVEENSLAKANSLLNQIKAEKKAIEEADIASAEQPVAAQEAEVVASEAPIAPPVAPPAAPIAAPTDEQIADDIRNKRFAKFRYGSESEVPEQFRDRISSSGETDGVPFVNVTLPQSVADYELSRLAPEAPVAPVAEEAITEEAIPVQEDEDLAALNEQIAAIENAPAEEEVVTEEVPAEPIASATEEEKQKSLEDEIESIKAQINSLRSEDGSVPSGKRAEFDRLNNLLTQAKANATRGNSTSVTPIKVMPEDIATQAPAFITDANEKAEAADLIEQAIQSSKTWEEAMRKIRKLGYVFNANDNMLLANYLKDRFNPDAPRIGNNKDSFQAWVNGKTDADLAAPEVVSAALAEEAAPEAPAAPAPKGRKKKEAPVTPAPAAPKPIEFGKQLEKKYGVRIDLLGKLDKGDLTLSRIEVPQTERGKGIGSKIMEEIIKYADENGKRIVLSPTKEFGATSVDRLRKFYKGFGFVENKGSNKDFTIKELMYRLPAKAEPAPVAEKETGAKESLGKRLKGDALLDAEDTLTELADNGATINPDGTVVVYHRTTKDKADAIVKNNEMFGLEDGVFFSTSEKGQAEGYGDVVVKMNVPIEQIQIDDTFGNEAHVRIPTKKANQKISVSKFAPQIAKAETKVAETKEDKKAEVKEEKGTPTTLSDIRNKFGEVAYGIAKKQQEVIGEEFTDLNRVERTADRIIELGGNDKGVAVAEALMYEIGYPDNFNDLRNAIKKGGIELNSQAVERMLEVGVELPNDILKEFQNSNRYKNASPEVVSIVEKQVGRPIKKAEAKTEIEEPTKKGVRFEKGKKLTEEEKKEVYKNLKDSYKEMKRPYTIETRVSQYTGRDYEARVWLENASDYMQTSDVTGRKLRYYIFLPDGTLAHPTEIFPNISASEMTRVQRNVEYNERQANEKMDDITSQLKKSGEIDKVVKAIETALKNGAEFVKEYDSNDVGQKNPVSVLLRFPNGSKWGIPEYVINTQKNILGFDQQDVTKNKIGEARDKIFLTNYQPDWEQFYNNNKQAEAKPSAPSFTSSQSSEAATAFDKAKTSKGFDKKHGKGAYKALSDITKNFEDIMDKVSDKIKQDCL